MKTTKTQIDKTKQILSDIIYTKRTKLGLSQERLAKICNIDRKTINRIENGHFSPNLETLVRIFTALDIKFDWLRVALFVPSSLAIIGLLVVLIADIKQNK
jgi:transcriptional regulator with XRE-family HTH domain